MRKIALVVACAVTLTGAPLLANAEVRCDERFWEINERFGAQMMELDKACYPDDAVQTGLYVCYPLSDECREKYEALAQETDQAFQDLYLECDTPVAMPGVVGVDENVALGSRARGSQAYRPKTQSGPTNKAMAKQIRQLKAKLRKAQSSLKASKRSCSKR